MAENTYDVGDRVRLTAAFTDPNNADAAIDPTTVEVHYRNPAGTVTTKVHVTDAEVVKDSVGNYHIDIDITVSGRWYSRWEGDGAAVAAEEISFLVRAQNVVPA